jgi:hypothetical protein
MTTKSSSGSGPLSYVSGSGGIVGDGHCWADVEERLDVGEADCVGLVAPELGADREALFVPSVGFGAVGVQLEGVGA